MKNSGIPVKRNSLDFNVLNSLNSFLFNFKNLCCKLAKNTNLENSKMGAKITDMLPNDCFPSNLQLLIKT